MKRSAAPGEVHARGGHGDARRYKLPIVPSDCEEGGVCLKFSCPMNTALEVTRSGAIKFQHEGGMGEAKTWPETDDGAFVTRLVRWVEGVETTCAAELIRKHGPMEMQDIGDALGISRELTYETLRSALVGAAAHPDAEALRDLLLARMEHADGRESSQPDHEDGP